MTIYTIYIEVETNIYNYQDLYYTMELYRFKPDGSKYYALKSTAKYPLQTNGKTQLHPSLDIQDKEQTSFIMSVMLYRKVGVEFIPLLDKPITNISPLKGFTSKDSLWGRSRNNICYLETTRPTQRAKEGSINTYQLKISCQQRIFIAKQHPIGDPLDPFTKAKVEEELKIRMTRPVPISYKSFQDRLKADRIGYYPNQARAMFCGPAVFFYCLQKDRPDLYQQVIKELWETGETKIGTLIIKPSKGVKQPKNYFNNENNTPYISAIDWISLGSLRDSENNIMKISSPRADWTELWWNYGAAVTMWWILDDWFIKAGATKLFDNISISHSRLQDIVNLNKFINADNHIVTLIGSGMIAEGHPQSKNHWIVWEDKLRVKDTKQEITINTSLDSFVELEMFSWGKVKDGIRKNLTLGEFLKYIYGGMVVSKIP